MLDVYRFLSFAEFFRSLGTTYAATSKARFTLDQWALRLGYKSPRTIAMILKGQRQPTLDLAQRVARDLRIDGDRQRYLRLLVECDRHKAAPAEQARLRDALLELRPKDLDRTLDPQEFAPIAAWHHLVIKQLIDTPDFRLDPHWISARLRSKVAVAEVLPALERLERLGLVARTGDDRGYAVVRDFVDAGSETMSDAIKHHHKGQLERAGEALHEQAGSECEIRSLTLKIDPERLTEAKRQIREFHRDFRANFAVKTGGAVYQLNVQMFSQTTSLAPRVMIGTAPPPARGTRGGATPDWILSPPPL